MLRRFCSEAALCSLPPKPLFSWLHRFYVVLDALATQHGVRASGQRRAAHEPLASISSHARALPQSMRALRHL